MQGVTPVKSAVFLESQLIRSVSLVFCGSVIPALAFSADQGYYFSCHVESPARAFSDEMKNFYNIFPSNP